MKTPVLFMFLGGLLLFFGGGDGPNPINRNDVLAGCYKADRASKTEILREMASKEFPSDKQQADWWNQQIETARTKDFQPFVDAVGDAIEDGLVLELAERVSP